MNEQLLLAPQPTNKRIADLGGADFYPTPEWATASLLDQERFDGSVWECACGDGAMSEVIKDYGYDVFSSDLYDRGYGKSGVDFISSVKKVDNVITNPPFHSAEQFVSSGLQKTSKKLALLLRLAFLESARRQTNIFNITPPSRVWVFSERITFYPKGAERKGNGTTAYAWFVWDKSCVDKTELCWLPIRKKKSVF